MDGCARAHSRRARAPAAGRVAIDARGHRRCRSPQGRVHRRSGLHAAESDLSDPARTCAARSAAGYPASASAEPVVLLRARERTCAPFALAHPLAFRYSAGCSGLATTRRLSRVSPVRAGVTQARERGRDDFAILSRRERGARAVAGEIARDSAGSGRCSARAAAPGTLACRRWRVPARRRPIEPLQRFRRSDPRARPRGWRASPFDRRWRMRN